jgi:Ca-activated chloride channel family protein
VQAGYFNLAHPEALQWLWLLVPLAALFVWDLRRRQRVLQLFVERSLLDDVSPRRSVGRPVVKFLVLAAGLSAMVFGLARPRWNPRQIELEQTGQNLLFCLDVSNSMRARDVDPSRLEAAKAAIRTLVRQLPAGNQVGLMAYAGSAQLKCPMTPNYRHLLGELADVTFNSVDVGGTNLGDAISRATHEVFGLGGNVNLSDKADPQKDDEETSPEERTVLHEEEPGEREQANVLIILTDGESHEGHAKEMAIEANKLGVAIYIIGLGTESGAPIPVMEDGRETTLKYKGEEVITEFDDASLRSVIDALPDRKGYLAAGASNVDLVSIYRDVIARERMQRRTRRFTVWEEKFQLFVGLGTALVVVSTLISGQQPMKRPGGRS